MFDLTSDMGRGELRFVDKLRGIQWGLILMIAAVAGIGFAMLYSAGNGNVQPWASKQMARFAIALVPMIGAALLDTCYWYRFAYWIYGGALLLVIVGDVKGPMGMGAQRWIDIGFMQL